MIYPKFIKQGDIIAFYQFTDIDQFGALRGYQLPFGVNEENIKEYVILG